MQVWWRRIPDRWIMSRARFVVPSASWAALERWTWSALADRCISRGAAETFPRRANIHEVRTGPRPETQPVRAGKVHPQNCLCLLWLSMEGGRGQDMLSNHDSMEPCGPAPPPRPPRAANQYGRLRHPTAVYTQRQRHPALSLQISMTID